MNDIGKKMFERRKELGLTLEEVGDAVGVGKSTVRRWENGMIRNMGRDKIAALAKVLQMNPVEFVPGDFYMNNTPTKDGVYTTIEQLSSGTLIQVMHKNPRLGLLFDKTSKMSEEDVDFMLQMADRILKERDRDG